jgi:hypothetical protein
MAVPELMRYGQPLTVKDFGDTLHSTEDQGISRLNQ